MVSRKIRIMIAAILALIVVFNMQVNIVKAYGDEGIINVLEGKERVGVGDNFSIKIVLADSNILDESAVCFSGNKSFIVINDSRCLRITDDLTIEFWIKLEQPMTRTYMPIVSKGFKNEYEVAVDTRSGKIYLAYRHGNGTTYESINVPAEVLSDGRWHHIALVRRSSLHIVEFYIDGLLIKYVTYKLDPRESRNNVYIGRRASSDLYFKGMLDELLIYNRALTTYELLEHSKKIVYLDSAKPVLYINFDSYIKDLSYCKNKIIKFSGIKLSSGLVSLILYIYYPWGAINNVIAFSFNGTFFIPLKSPSSVGKYTYKIVAMKNQGIFQKELTIIADRILVKVNNISRTNLDECERIVVLFKIYYEYDLQPFVYGRVYIANNNSVEVLSSRENDSLWRYEFVACKSGTYIVKIIGIRDEKYDLSSFEFVNKTLKISVFIQNDFLILIKNNFELIIFIILFSIFICIARKEYVRCVELW